MNNMNTSKLEQHLEKLYIFRTIAQEESLSKAALKLGLTQSAVSRSLATLEQALEIQLSHRHRRGVVLTKEGGELFKYCQKLQYELKDLERILQNPNELAGEVHIGTYETLGVSLWPKLLRRIQAQYPEVSINLITNDPDQHWSKLDGGILQLILDAEPHLKENYYSRPLYSDRFGIFQGTKDCAATSVATVCRAYDEKGLTTLQYLEKHGFTVPYRMDSFISVLSLVEANICLGVLPLKLAELGIKNKTIKPYPSPSKHITFGSHRLCITSLESTRHEKKLKAISDVIKKAFQ
ncbi:MAG: LysR family transcriptional regulator [Bdellovibrionales bacterium]|nr:LysR family transcriptional regulator [Bdellovibrionales bacterium]